MHIYQRFFNIDAILLVSIDYFFALPMITYLTKIKRKEMMNMTNLQRLLLETKEIELDQNELAVYLAENNLNPHDEYNPQSATNKRNIYKTALSILESIANNPKLMKAYKLDDMTITDFHENLLNRIDQLERKIRSMKTDEQEQAGNVFMLFNS